MEIIQNIWTALTTPNEWIFNILSIPLSFLENTVMMLLFITILNIETTKKQRYLYVIIISIYSILSLVFIPKPYGTYINIIIGIFITSFTLKTNIFKAIIAEIIPFIVTASLETIFGRLFLIIFRQPYEYAVSIPIYRLSMVLIIYTSIFIIYKIIKYYKFHIILSENFDNKTKVLLILNSIVGLVTLGIQFYLMAFYYDKLPIFIILLTTLSFLSYFFISIYSLIKTTKLEITKRNLQEAQLYNKSLKILHDNLRAFRHDFSNIVQAIGGYAESKDFDGLKKYYSQLLEDCQHVNNLETLNPDLIDNPAIYSILASKYHKADELGIKINLEILIDLNTINIKIYEFTRILGILLDNAIEASNKCEEKVINVQFSQNDKTKKQIVTIQNTYINKDVDIEKIYEKGYTSKEDNLEEHGLGLWEVRKILKKHNNLNLFTTKNEKYFTQQLEIFIN